jgi:hypothetical protein
MPYVAVDGWLVVLVSLGRPGGWCYIAGVEYEPMQVVKGHGE